MTRLDQLRAYAGEPWKYIRDRLCVTLTGQQEEALELMEEVDRLLIPAANAVGKTFLLAAYGLYVFEVLGSMPDKDRERQGGRILLPGPDAATVYATVYSEMLMQALRAEEEGEAMPGVRSERSVHWYVPGAPMWNMEAFSPPRRQSEAVRHSAAGRHHRNMVALIEEGQGVDEPTWKGVEGMCVSSGNKIISSFNPTEPSGPAYQRALRGDYEVLHLDAFDHPNIARRQYVVPAAIDFKRVDDRVRMCQDLGPASEVSPDSEHNDFVYALPPKGAKEEGRARKDGVPGHPKGEVHVFRPDWDFQARVRGQYPKVLESGLFSPGAWDEAVRRWKASPPRGTPNRVGIDVARQGGDETCASPCWGVDPESLLRSFLAAQGAGAARKMKALREKRRIQVGRAVTFQRGDGPDVARSIFRQFSGIPMNVDEGGVGASVLDHLKRVLGADAAGVAFGSAPMEPLPGEQFAENLRASMYVRAALLIRLGLADAPDDPLLREEIMATDIIIVDRSIKVEQRDGTIVVERHPSVRLIDKKKIKKQIGRSPDRADSFVLALHSPRRRRMRKVKRSAEMRL